MAVVDDKKPMYALDEIEDEVRRASAKHAPMHSHHEAYAVIAEEFQVEYWGEVVKGGAESGPRRAEDLRKELIHTAAMCVRALHDLC
jgi:ABC-type Zn2+ transport system substrate-binding protein/surface adhesin